MRRLNFGLAVIGLGLLAGGWTIGQRALRVGDRGPEGTVLPTGERALASGATALLKAAVVDAVPTRDGMQAFVKTSKGISLVELRTGWVLNSLELKEGTSLTGLALADYGAIVACSTARSSVQLWKPGRPTSSLDLGTAAVGGESYPCGLSFVDGGLLVAANRDNSVIFLPFPSSPKHRKRIVVDPAPYGVLGLNGHEAIVTCWGRGGDKPSPTASSSGTLVEVDGRGIATGGTVCRVDLETGSVEHRVDVAAQPTEMAVDGQDLYVACANSNTVSVLNLSMLEVKGEIRIPGPVGAAPDSLAIDPNRHRLYVACGGLNRVLAYDLLGGGRLLGSIRTAWYPSVVRVVRGGLLIGTAKGIGSRSGDPSKRSVYDITGTLSFVPNPRLEPYSAGASNQLPARTGIAAAPVPERLGEPSVFRHVVYVIKENRTYDQLLGDMPEGNGDPKLAMFGEKVTPNHHALAREFALLDNYYCNGIVSADGHAWATEANATTYYERSRGGWTRSYPFGDDPLATSSSGYLWDNCLDHGRTVRNFGEFDYATPDPDLKPTEILRRFQSGQELHFKQNIGVERLRNVSEPGFPGWNLAIPDILRADRFVKRLHEIEAQGDMADLTILYLPQDHTSGGSPGYPSPRAQVADNDLALGDVIDALSHSKFWPSTVVFVEEDDPQNGFDHVDGYRSICLVVSPYTRRHAVVSEFYNQAGVIHTMEQILGLPTMNRNDTRAALMTECFQAQPDLKPYEAKPNQVPLDELPPAGKRTALRLDKPDQVDDEVMNRRLSELATQAHEPSTSTGHAQTSAASARRRSSDRTAGR